MYMFFYVIIVSNKSVVQCNDHNYKKQITLFICTYSISCFNQNIIENLVVYSALLQASNAKETGNLYIKP